MAVASLPKIMDTFWPSLLPFWVVLRCSRDPRQQPNMQMHTVVFELPGAKILEGIIFGDNVRSPLITKVILLVFSNDQSLKQDDVLRTTYQGGSLVLQ